MVLADKPRTICLHRFSSTHTQHGQSSAQPSQADSTAAADEEEGTYVSDDETARLRLMVAQLRS